MSTPVTKTEDELYTRIASIIEASRSHVSRSINTAMVHAYWLIGREIVEVEQQGEERAEYGTELMKRLAERLTQQYGKGLSARTLRRVRQFYLVYPEGSALSDRGRRIEDSDNGVVQIRSPGDSVSAVGQIVTPLDGPLPSRPRLEPLPRLDEGRRSSGPLFL